MAEGSPDSARQTRQALAVTAGAWLALFGPYLFFGGLPVFRDLLLTYVPLRLFWAERVLAGALPGWFPWEGLGEPFLGQGVSATYSPFNLPWLVFPPALALRLEVASALLLGALGQTWLARRYALAPPAAVTGALALVLSGYALSMTSNPVYLRGLCLLPWVAAFAHAVLLTPKPPWEAVGLGVTWALILLGGDAASTLLAAPVVAAVALGEGASPRWGWLVAGALLAGLLAAPELLPASAVRADSFVADFKNADFLSRYWALHPERWPELLLPGVATLQEGWARAQAQGEPGRWAESVLLGVAPLALACCVPAARRPLWYLALGGLGVWLACGAHGGLEVTLRRALPFLNTVRYPEKHLALAVFGLSTAAAFGAQESLRAPRRAWLAGGAGALITLAVSFGADGARGRTQPLLEALGAAAAVAVVALAAARLPRLAWLFPVVVAVTLWREPLGLVTVPPEEALAPPALVPAGAGRVWVERGPVTQPVDDESLRGWVRDARETLAGDLGAVHRRAAFGLTANLPLAPRGERALLGWTLSHTRALAPLYGYEVAVTAGGEVLRLDAAPRAYLASPRGLASGREVVAALRADPAAARRHPLVWGVAAEPAEEPVGDVTALRDQVDAVEVDATLARAGLLVLNDAWAPGWRAEVGGQPAPVLQVNGLVRGVMLSAGTHRVRFAYEAPRAQAGRWLGALGLLAIAGLVFLGARRRG